MFGKWLPFGQLLELVPFLAASGLPGFLAVTIVILTSCRGSNEDQRSQDIPSLVATITIALLQKIDILSDGSSMGSQVTKLLDKH